MKFFDWLFQSLEYAFVAGVVLMGTFGVFCIIAIVWACLAHAFGA